MPCVTIERQRIIAFACAILLCGQRLSGEPVPTQPWQLQLNAEDAQRSSELNESIDRLVEQSQLQRAAERAHDLVAIHNRALGTDHWSTRDCQAVWDLLQRATRIEPAQRDEFVGAWRDFRIVSNHDARPPSPADASRTAQASEAAQRSELLDRCEKSFLSVGGPDHPLVASIRAAKSSHQYRNGKYQAAARLADEALRGLRLAYGDRHPGTARCLELQGLAHMQMGHDPRAEQSLRAAVDAFRGVFGEEHEEMMRCLGHLGHVLSRSGNHREALPLLTRVMKFTSDKLGPGHPETAKSYLFVASNLRESGQLIAAERMLHDTIALARTHLGNESECLGSCFAHLGLCLRQQGRYAPAEQAYREALRIMRHAKGNEHPQTALCVWNVAVILNLQRRYADAEQAVNEFIALEQKIRASDGGLFFLDAYELLFESRLQQGKRQNAEEFVQLQRLLRQSVENNRQRLGEQHIRTAVAYVRLATYLEGAKSFQEARDLYNAALAICRKTEGDLHSETIKVRQRLGKLNYLLGDDSRAEQLLAEAADAIEKSRAAHGYVGLGYAAERSINPNLPLLSMILARRGRPIEAWQRLEQAKARGLLDDLTTRRENGESHESTAAVGKAFELDRIQSYLSPDTALVAWATAWWNHNDQGESWACVVRSQGEPHWIRLTGSGRDGRLSASDAQLGRHVIASVATPPRRGQSWNNDELQSFRAVTLDPIETFLGPQDGLPAARHLIVAFPSPSNLPIEVLTDRYVVSYAPSATVWAWLRERNRADATPREKRLLAVADPEYAEPIGALARRDGSPSANVRDYPSLPGTRSEVETISQLFGDAHVILSGRHATREEIQKLASADRLKDFAFLHFATHGEANDAAPLQSAIVLGRSESETSSERAIQSRAPNDGRLTAEQVLRTWKLDAELVTLSACETAWGPIQDGEQFIGFSHALFLAGARSVVLSLWNVRDDATSLLMRRFYENLLASRPDLRASLSKAEALHDAKQWLRTLRADQLDGLLESFPPSIRSSIRQHRADTPIDVARPFEHPYFWAPFILIGADR
jgi:CHAT domain-containing protein/tetratricopeptide (TPR) repeat protein